MQSHELLEPIRDEYSECCLTNDYQENHCRIDLTGLDPSTLNQSQGEMYISLDRTAVATQLGPKGDMRSRGVLSVVFKIPKCTSHLGIGLVTIHGDQNQQCSKHKRPGRLCDRLIFGYLGREFICAAEIKGGKNPEVPKAVRQIQGGLDLARELLNNRTQGDWYPLLFFSGKMKGNDLRALSTKTVSFGGKKKRVVRINCGASLRRMLTNDT